MPVSVSPLYCSAKQRASAIDYIPAPRFLPFCAAMHVFLLLKHFHTSNPCQEREVNVSNEYVSRQQSWPDSVCAHIQSRPKARKVFDTSKYVPIFVCTCYRSGSPWRHECMHAAEGRRERVSPAMQTHFGGVWWSLNMIELPLRSHCMRMIWINTRICARSSAVLSAACT